VCETVGARSRSIKPMNEWEQLYQDGDTRWDKGEPSPGLLEWLGNASFVEGSSVLVPGCGFGHDVRALARAGFKAVGLDVAPSAVSGAREQTPADFSGVEFREGDFLKDEPFDGFDYVFEHTCFCAIEPSERDVYAASVAQWLNPGGFLLAIHYMLPPDEDGPPFGTNREEIVQRFSGGFDLITDWEPSSWEHRQGQEQMFLWSKKV
jgi:SAM-dependent methyltransferase